MEDVVKKRCFFIVTIEPVYESSVTSEGIEREDHRPLKCLKILSEVWKARLCSKFSLAVTMS